MFCVYCVYCNDSENCSFPMNDGKIREIVTGRIIKTIQQAFTMRSNDFYCGSKAKWYKYNGK